MCCWCFFFQNWFVHEGNKIFEIEDDELLGESNNVRIRDNVNTLDDELLGEDGPLVPKVGMKFKDKNEVFKFYKPYAYNIRFPVRNGIWRRVTMGL